MADPVVILGVCAVLAAYYCVSNSAAFCCFKRDKRFAQEGGHRTPERTLHATGLAGGCIGGVVSMRRSVGVPEMCCVHG